MMLTPLARRMQAFLHKTPASLRLLSSARPNSTTSSDEKDGAWTVLAALEKAKEAQGIQVARLVSSLEALLPRTPDESGAVSQQHTTRQGHTSDPAFFSLDDPTAQVTGAHVLRLLQATRRGRRIDLHTIEALLKAATTHFGNKQKIVSLPSLQQHQQLTVIGDLHGSLSDLAAVLGITGEPSENNILLFNGDLADRGDHGMEIIVIVCALSCAYPGLVHVNRGNHEDLALSVAYGLAAEVQHKYGSSVFRNILGPLLDAFFRSLPLATVIEKDAFIVHAGPPPPGMSISDVRNYCVQQDDDDCGPSRTIRTKTDTDKKAVDGAQPSVQEVVEALLWSDPAIDEEEGSLADYYHGRNANDDGTLLGWRPNVSRGAGFKYDSNIVRHLLHAEGLSRLVRSHEPVHHGCARYVLQPNDDDLEFFTVFSASRYPYKEGFNQGALLRLLPNGKHRVFRYATEEDEPLVVGSCRTSFDGEDTSQLLSEVDFASLRRALREAVASHRLELVESFEQSVHQHSGDGIPFDEAVDILIETMKLDEPGLRKPAARLALARALSTQCHDTPPQTIDLIGCIDALMEESDDDDMYVPEMAPSYPWLRAVFELVDVDHNGVISHSEWMAAVATINSKLPKETTPIDAEDTWNILDFNGDGHVTSSEWNELGKALSR